MRTSGDEAETQHVECK